jgi:hypothetical protein
MANAKNAQNNEFCYDCKKEIKSEKGKLKNGVFLVYKSGFEEYNILKCNDCYEKNPGLTDYRPCEVYSRIVGYLRPIQQWNVGKVQEYKKRKEYKTENVSTI